MKPKRVNLFVPFTRDQVLDDRQEVWGRVTSAAVDSFGTVFDHEASVRAMTAWTDKFERATGGLSKGNIREMHQRSAVGTAIAWTPDDAAQAIDLGTHIVDEPAWAKVKAGVYTGFSIGANANRIVRKKVNGKTVPVITDYELVEVSLVDSPSNPDATFEIVRRDPAGTQTRAEDAPVPGVDAGDAAAEEEKARKKKRKKRADGTEEPEVAPTTQSALEQAAAVVPNIGAPPAGQPQPTPAAPPAIAAEEPMAPETPTADGNRAAEVYPQAQALEFDPAKFDSAQARTWAQAHGYRVHADPTTQAAPNATLRLAQRREDLFLVDTLQRVDLVDGVQLVTGQLKNDIPGRVRVALERRRDKLRPALLRMATGEGMSIVAALRALEAISAAIDSEVYGAVMSEGLIPEDEAADVALLVGSAEGLLAYMANEFQEVLSSLTAVTGTARAAATSDLERVVALRRALTPTQIQRMEEDEAFIENMGKMHEMAHSLMDATGALGAPCPIEGCQRAEGDEEEEPAPAPAEGEGKGEPAAAPPGEGEEERQDDDEETPPPPAGEGAPTGEGEGGEPAGEPAPAAPEGEEEEEGEPRRRAATPGSTPTGDRTDEVLAAVRGIQEAVNVRLDAQEGRLDRIGEAPADIGRPARAVDKGIGGNPPVPDGLPAATAKELERLAATETDPGVKQKMLLRAASLTIEQTQAGR